MNRTNLRVFASLVLGPCLVPDSRVWRRPTLFMADETGDVRLFSCTYLLPVRGVETFRNEQQAAFTQHRQQKAVSILH